MARFAASVLAALLLINIDYTTARHTHVRGIGRRSVGKRRHLQETPLPAPNATPQPTITPTSKPSKAPTVMSTKVPTVKSVMSATSGSVMSYVQH